jgi:hypothetical protein
LMLALVTATGVRITDGTVAITIKESGNPETRPFLGPFRDSVSRRVPPHNDRTPACAGVLKCPRQESNLEPSD